MSGYTKLFSSIVGSTIWGESNETKILWITMLAIADKYGEVSASVPGLAQLARLNLDEVTRGLEKLMSPDKYSRTKDYEGRRIKEIDGGWLILNHGKYREKMNEDERREKNAEYQRRFRRKNSVSKSNDSSDLVSDRKFESALSAHAEAESDPESDSESSKKTTGARKVFSDERQMRFAKQMWARIKALNPEAKEPNLNAWANDVRLMETADKRDLNDAWDLFRRANEHVFWQTNILCPKKLREQFDNLHLKLRTVPESKYQELKPPTQKQ